MIFYELSLLVPPRFYFAHRVDLKNYANRFENPPFFEISFLEEGSILFTDGEGKESIVMPGALAPIFPDAVCSTVAYRGERQRHSTVAILAGAPFTRFDREIDAATLHALKKRISSGESALIPFREQMDEYAPEVLRRLKRLIAFIHSNVPSDRLHAVGEWYTLLSVLSEFVLKKIDDPYKVLHPSEEIYAKRAADCLRERYREDIKVKELTEQLGLSEGYLHRIFKRTYGQGLIEYRNRYRVETAISLMRSEGMSLAEAAANVGIEDASYMSRLFKKVMGVSAREFFREKEIK